MIARRGLLSLGLVGLAGAGVARAAEPDPQPDPRPDPLTDPEAVPSSFSLSPVPTIPTPPGPRRLTFRHLHTAEDLDVTYWRDGHYDWDGLAAVRKLLRDFRSGEEHPIDVRLLDILVTLRAMTGSSEPFRIISAFRSPATNDMLRDQSAAVNGGDSQVARKSLHMEGKAMDVRLNDVSLTGLRDAALRLGGGGVGYYPDSAFVHVDIGPVRTWQRT